MKKLILIVGIVLICGIGYADEFDKFADKIHESKQNSLLIDCATNLGKYMHKVTWLETEVLKLKNKLENRERWLEQNTKTLIKGYDDKISGKSLQDKYDELFLDYAELKAENKQLKERIKSLIGYRAGDIIETEWAGKCTIIESYYDGFIVRKENGKRTFIRKDEIIK